MLVYDSGSYNSFAATAAENLYPGEVTIGNSSSFNTLLASQTWDIVLVDCGSATPTSGWQPLVDYVDGEGAAVLSFWDWDDSNDSLLLAPFDVSSPITFGLSTQVLQDAGSSSVFQGVTMPNSDWSSNFFDDGDTFTPLAGAIGLAHFGDVNQPNMVLGNEGRTIATFVLDEAGPTWIGDGSGVRLWENMIEIIGDREPQLEVLGLVPGEFITLGASRMTVGSQVHFLVSSVGAGPTVTPFGTLEVSQPWRRTPAFPADADGAFDFTSTLPIGASGATFYMQSVVFEPDDVVRLSNPLAVPIP